MRLPSILKKTLVSITGLVLAGFVLFHLLGNILYFGGPEAFNAYAHTLQSMPMPIKWGGRLFLLACAIVHVWMAVMVTRENRRARPHGYAESALKSANPASMTMIHTGGILLFFIVVHLLHFTVRWLADYNERFGDGYTLTEGALSGTKVMDAHAMVASGFANPLVSLFYVVAMAVLCLHLAHGVQSLFQSLGWMTRRWRARMKGVALAYGLVIFVGFASIPIAVLVFGTGKDNLERYETTTTAAATMEMNR